MKVKSILFMLKKEWRELWILALFVALSPVMELLNRPFGTVHNLWIFLDGLIPFTPQFVLTYHSWMPSLILLGLYFFINERANYYGYSLAVLIGQGLAHLTFPFYQTVIPRHVFELAPQGLFETLVQWTYTVDNNYCGFPSIHVLTSTIAIGVTLRSKMKPLIKALVVLHFSFIIASTLLIKQHVFLDLPGGVLYAAFGFMFWPLSQRLYRKATSQNTKRLNRRTADNCKASLDTRP